MDSQWYTQVRAWSQTSSFHFTFPPESAIVQISLSSRYDYDDWAVPISKAYGVFYEFATSDRGSSALDPLTSAFESNNLTEVTGFLEAENCFAQAIVNVFVWPSVW